MSRDADAETRPDRRRPRLPANGPLDAILGFVVFYVFVDRATPTVVEVFAGAVPGVSESLVRLGLAAVLWFILAATTLDQIRRQLAALGVGRREDVGRAERSRAIPTGSRVTVYVAVFVLGGVVATLTFEPAVRAGIAMIRVVGTLDPSLFPPFEFVTMVVFFVTFAAATKSLDRLVVGGVRWLLAR